MKIIYFNGRFKINYKTRKCTFEQNLMENQKTYRRPKGSTEGVKNDAFARPSYLFSSSCDLDL